jgi:hypothetical protein
MQQMKIRSHQLVWALFLLAAGAFLLLKNNGVLRDLGDAIWGGVFALMGLGFLAWFLVDRRRHWRAIAGFPLLASGALFLLDWSGIGLGDWQAALILLGLALGFWTALLTHDDNWWALIPAGALTLMAVLTGFQARLNEGAWLGVFFLGLGLVFGLLYLLRLGQQDTGWAGIPAAAFFLIGLVTLVSALKLTGVVAQWWPALLLAGGVVMLFLAVNQLGSTAPAETISRPPSPTPGGAGPDLPAATPPAPPPAPAPAQEPPIDIYAMLAKQPKEDVAPEK